MDYSARREHLTHRYDAAVRSVEAFGRQHPECQVLFAALLADFNSLRASIKVLTAVDESPESVRLLEETEAKYAVLEQGLLAVFADYDPLLPRP